MAKYQHLRHLIKIPTARQFHQQQAARAKFMADLEHIQREARNGR